VAGNGVPRAVGQGRVALLPALEVPCLNGTGQTLQGFGSRSQGELDGSGCLSAVAAGKMTIDQAMFALKDAYERKANFEEMGYILPPKKTEYPFWVDEMV